jgi:hypothetical protein
MRGFQAFRKEVVLWTIAVLTNEVVPPEATAGGLSPTWVFRGAATRSYGSPCASYERKNGSATSRGAWFPLGNQAPVLLVNSFFAAHRSTPARSASECFTEQDTPSCWYSRWIGRAAAFWAGQRHRMPRLTAIAPFHPTNSTRREIFNAAGYRAGPEWQRGDDPKDKPNVSDTASVVLIGVGLVGNAVLIWIAVLFSGAALLGVVVLFGVRGVVQSLYDVPPRLRGWRPTTPPAIPASRRGSVDPECR